MGKVKGKYTKGLNAQDFLDFSSQDIRSVAKEQKIEHQRSQIKKIGENLGRAENKLRKTFSKRGKPVARISKKGARVNVKKGTKSLWDLI